ncbi:MAG: Kup system potassium uptake protein, partial [uncultured Gemmatimonadetes bacterium]
DRPQPSGTDRPLFLRPGADGARRGVRRHRDQPALRHPRVVPRPLRHRGHARERVRRALPDLLGADHRHLHQVPAVRDEGGQPGRGGDDRADRAGCAAPRDGARPPLGPGAGGALRGLAAVRRQHDHPGHLRDERRGGAEGGHSALHALHPPHHHHHPGDPLRGAEPRHGGDRQGVRAGDGALVRDAGGAGGGADRTISGGDRSHQPGVRRQLLRPQRVAGVPGAGLRLPGGDGRRGAVRGHGALRQEAHPVHLVHPGPSRAGAQLLRAGGADPARPQGGGAPVLPHGAAVGHLSPGRARYAGHGDRVAGGDLGRLLAHAAGGAARLPAAHGDRAHLGAGDGADLHPRGELGADGGVHRAGAGLPVVQPAGGGVRRGGDHGHGVHHHPLRLRGAHAVEVERAARGAAGLRLPGGGPGVLGRQHRQDPAGRLVPARHRGGDVRRDDHLEEGPPDPGVAAAVAHAPHRAVHDGRGEEPARPRGGDGRVHVRHQRRHAPGAPPQPDPQQGAARAGGAPHRLYPGGAHGARGRAARGARDRLGVLEGGDPLRLHRGPAHPGGAGRAPAPGAGLQAHGDQLLPGTRDADPLQEPGDGAVARALLLDHVAQRAHGHLVLLASAQPGGGAGGADRAL